MTVSDSSLSGYGECTIAYNNCLAYPSGVPTAVPGTILAVNYDLGGQGVSYNDTTPTQNTGGAFRPSEGVDIRAINNDPNQGYLVKDIFAGEWLNFTVNIAQGGSYTIGVLEAGTNAGKYLHFQLDGTDIANSQINLPATANFDTGVLTTSATVTLPAGVHVLKAFFDTGDFNLISFILTSLAPVNQAPIITMPSNVIAAMPSAASAGRWP